MDLEDYIKKLIHQMMIGENNYKNNEMNEFRFIFMKEV